MTSTDINFQENNNIGHLKYEGSIDPKVTGGFDNGFMYKNWKMNVYFTYQFGNVIRLYPEFSAVYSDMSAMPKEMKNRWMQAGNEKYTDVPGIPSKRQVSNIENLNVACLLYTSTLPVECRTVFQMSRFEGLSNQEIAERLNISINTVKYHIKKALSVLKEGLGDYLFAIVVAFVFLFRH